MSKRKVKKLSQDEMGLIAEFSKKEDLYKLKNYEYYNHIDALRCKNTEIKFKELTGLWTDEFIEKYYERKKFIIDAFENSINNLCEEYDYTICISITDEIYDYLIKRLSIISICHIEEFINLYTRYIFKYIANGIRRGWIDSYSSVITMEDMKNIFENKFDVILSETANKFGTSITHILFDK